MQEQIIFSAVWRIKYLNGCNSQKQRNQSEISSGYIFPMPAVSDEGMRRRLLKGPDFFPYNTKIYTNYLTSGRLNAYLAGIDRQAQEHFERLIDSMKQAQDITEQLREENALEWTGRLNSIRACAREIVEKEIIYA